jgi:hypothetical protein
MAAAWRNNKAARNIWQYQEENRGEISIWRNEIGVGESINESRRRRSEKNES